MRAPGSSEAPLKLPGLTTGPSTPHPVAPQPQPLLPQRKGALAALPWSAACGAACGAILWLHSPPHMAQLSAWERPWDWDEQTSAPPRAEPQPPRRERAAEEQSHAPCREETDAAGPALGLPLAVTGDERCAGTRGCRTTSCPSPASQHQHGGFMLEGCWVSAGTEDPQP